MPNHLTIGANYGEAATWDPNYAIGQFNQVLQQQKAEKAAKDQALIDQASQLKPDAIRDADKPDYQQKYNDWKQTAQQANALPNNSRQRLDALASAQSKYNDLGSFIAQSKKEGANEHGLSQQWIGNQHLFSDPAHAQFMKSMQSPMSSPDFVPGNDYQNFQRYIDHSKVDDGFDKAHQTLLKQQEWSNPIQSQGVDKQGNKTGVVIHNEREASPEDLLANDMHMYKVDDATKASIDSRYGSIVGDSPDHTIAARLRQNLIDRGDVTVGKDGSLQSTVNEKTKPEFKANYKPDLFYEHHLWDWANNPNQVPQGIPNPQGQNIPYAGSGVVHAPNYVPVSLPSKNFAGASSINMETGKPESALASSADYSIVGAGDFPVSKYSGVLLQPNFVQQHPDAVTYKRMVHVQQKDPDNPTQTSNHLVPYENLPKNVAGQKDVRQALAGLNKTPVYGSQNTPATTIRVKLKDGRMGNIPSAKLKQFQADNPDAQIVQ